VTSAVATAVYTVTAVTPVIVVAVIAMAAIVLRILFMSVHQSVFETAFLFVLNILIDLFVVKC